MLKSRTTLPLAALFLMLAACTPAGNQILSQSDAGKTFEFETGETFSVVLPGNITTGYTWQVANDSTAPVKQVGEPEFEPGSSAIGAGGTISLTFEANNPGDGALKLVYLRPWETGIPPIDTFEVHLIVR